MTASAAIAVEGLVKSYGGVRVVDGVSFTVAAGGVCALLGPNGAGKTTTVECIEGFRVPDAGTVRVLGLDPRADRPAVVARMGVMLQEGGAYQAATPREMLALYARFHRRPADPATLLDAVGLTAAADRRYRVLSGGQKQRLNLALALVGQPRVVVLDEPTAGMDPQARQTTWELLRGLRDGGTAVLLTTHAMDEAERLADTVVVLDAGRVVAQGSPAALVAGDADPRLLVTTPVHVDPGRMAAGLGVPVERDGAGRFIVHAPASAIPTVTAWFDGQGLPLTGVSAGGGLEDLFLRLVGRRVRE